MLTSSLSHRNVTSYHNIAEKLLTLCSTTFLHPLNHLQTLNMAVNKLFKGLHFHCNNINLQIYLKDCLSQSEHYFRTKKNFKQINDRVDDVRLTWLLCTVFNQV